jgi:hypothetical protein
MRKSLIFIMVIAIGMISLVGFECFAEDVYSPLQAASPLPASRLMPVLKMR